jgi:hypothetical protein
MQIRELGLTTLLGQPDLEPCSLAPGLPSQCRSFAVASCHQSKNATLRIVANYGRLAIGGRLVSIFIM